MSDIIFNPGVLYVGSPDGELHPLGECEETELCEAVENKDIPRINDILSSSENTFTLTLTQAQVDAFFETLFKIREVALDLIQEAGYSRIAHLATRAKKHRTRKKNLHRAYQILTREG